MRFQTVLLIDDDEDDTEIFQEAVREVAKSLKCIVAHDATQALAKLESGVLTPDIIFLDLNMPVMSGQKFLQEIKFRPSLREIPVVIFSTSSHQKTIELTKELGASDFITKPGRFDDLVKILDQFFNQ